MEYIRRHIESVIEESAKMFKAVILTGARQTGKATLLEKKYGNLSYISFDNPFDEEQAKAFPDAFMDMHKPPVIFDEIQYVPELFRYIKIKCDEQNNKGMYFLSGSQPFNLMNLAAESLAGRAAVLELSTLSLREIMKSDFNEPFKPVWDYVEKRRKTVRKPDDIWRIIHRGFYPELMNEKIDWQRFYAGYVQTYLERDVRQLSAVSDLDSFRRFMIACAARTGEMLNYSNIASEIGKDADTIKRWISVLEASGIIYLLEPFTNSALKKAIKTPKLYFRDTGLAAYLTRWLTPETLASGAMAGAFFETFTISEILKSYANRGMDYRYFVSYYRGRDKKANGDNEIDFIIEEDGILYPIEVKLTSKPKSEMTKAFMVLDNIEKKKRGTGAVVCLCPEPGLLRENIFAIPAYYL